MSEKSNEAAGPRFSIAIDDMIIDGFFDDLAAMLRKMRNLGFSRDEIMDRTRILGLSRQFVKQCTLMKSDVALRECLGCSERFLSAGVGNRMCKRCKGRS